MFCGSDQGLRCYLTDILGSAQYACAKCVTLIHNENWEGLIKRVVAAFASLQLIPEDEQVVFRQELKTQLQALITCDLPVM
jgi:hypothetical protein